MPYLTYKVKTKKSDIHFMKYKIEILMLKSLKIRQVSQNNVKIKPRNITNYGQL